MDYIKMTPADRIINFIISAFLIVIAIICLYPILYVLLASFSDPILLSQNHGLLFAPLKFTIDGYKAALGYSGIYTGYLNTFYIVTIGTAISMVLTIAGAYVLSRKELYTYRILNILVIFTLYFSGGLIPTYLVVKNLGLIDNLFAVMLPVAINTWNLIILRTSMSALPESLIESARIDGANDIMILLRIVIPLVKATLAVLTLYYVVGQWNSWFNAMIYLKTRSLYPLQLILREILIANTSNAASSSGMDPSLMDKYKQLVKYCTTIIATVPILFAYPFLQKYFVKGVLIGSVKE